MSDESRDDFEKLKDSLLMEFRLISKQYRNQFDTTCKREGESWIKFSTRLKTLLRYYLRDRRVDSFDELLGLVILDRMKEGILRNAY